MSANDSEEKKFPPTPTKLRRARREGQIPHANDVLALAALPLLIWLIFTWSSFEAGLRRLLTSALVFDFRAPATDIAKDAFFGAVGDYFAIVIPIFVVTIIIALVVAIIDNQGIVFSGKPVAPNFSRLNPVQGFKRIFSERTGVESLFGLVKLTLFAGVTFLIYRLAIDDLLRVQACGLACIPSLLDSLLYPLIIAFVALFLIVAVIDFLLSRALFARENRMSYSELKRENKDVYGNPDIKRRRRDLSQDILSGPARMGLESATMIFVGRDALVGIRYVANDTPAPFVVLKAAGERRQEVLNDARRRGLAIVRSERTTGSLYRDGVLGNVIPRATFTSVAQELMRAGQA